MPEAPQEDVATPPVDYTVYSPSCDQTPDPMPAFGHFGEEEKQSKMLSEEERAKLLAKPVNDMNSEEFSQMMADGNIPTDQMQAMLDKTSASPERKLELWKKLHGQRNQEELEATLPADAVGDDAAKKAERETREKTLATTQDELALETSELPKNFTMKDVDALIARKEKEHALEQQYGINITATNAKRADGSRVMWTESELDQIKTSLDQVPPEMFEDGRVKFNELERVEDIFEYNADGSKKMQKDGTTPVRNNADCHPNGKIRMADLSTKGGLEDRDMKTNEFECENGFQSTPMERVFLHELGHAVNHGDPSTQTVHEEQWKTLPGDRRGSGEYFAQDFNHALTAPEKFYQDTFQGTKDAATKAQADYDKNPTPENKAALDEKLAEAKAYPEMYKNMRNNVFHTDVRENEIASDLEQQGYTPDEINAFREEALKVSTPAQLDELARRQGYEVRPRTPETN